MTVRPLLITREEDLAQEMSRLATVAGCGLQRGDPGEPGPNWRSAPMVLLDYEAADTIAEIGPRRRPGVVVLYREATPELWRAAFGVGAERTIELPAQENELVDLLATTDTSVDNPGTVLAVVGGSGGAGASTLACATALEAARRGDECLLLDCDPLGGGLDLLIGTEDDPGLRWSGLTVSGGRVASGALYDVLPVRKTGSGTLSMLSCDRDEPSSGLTAEAVQAVLESAKRGGETVICDVPRSLPKVARTALRTADRTILVVPAEVRSCAAARRVVAHLADMSTGPIGAVLRAPGPGGLTATDAARAVGLDVLAVLRRQNGVSAEVDRGGLWPRAHGSLARAARRVLDAGNSTTTMAGVS